METKLSSEDFERLARQCAEICEERKASDIRLYNVQETSVIADYYLICTAHSDPHIRAVSANIEKQLKNQNIYPRNVEGVPSSHWMVMDYGGLMIHIFHPDTRKYYCLEELWSDHEVLYQTTGEEET